MVHNKSKLIWSPLCASVNSKWLSGREVSGNSPNVNCHDESFTGLWRAVWPAVPAGSHPPIWQYAMRFRACTVHDKGTCTQTSRCTAQALKHVVSFCVISVDSKGQEVRGNLPNRKQMANNFAGILNFPYSIQN